MRLPRLAAALAAFVAAASAAFALTLTTTYPGLAQKVQDELALIPSTGLTKDLKKRQSALTKALAALQHEGDDLATRIKDATKAAASLEKIDAEGTLFGAELAKVADDMRASVESRRAELETGSASLPDGRAATKIASLLAKALEQLTESDAQPDVASRLKAIGKARATVGKAGKAYDKAAPAQTDVTTTAFDVDVGASHLHLPPESGLYAYTTIYNTGGPGIFNVTANLIGQHSMVLFVTNPGLGERAVTTVGSSYSGSGTGALPLTSGTITFTAWDPASNKVAATFTATFSNGQTTVTLTNGVLTSTNLIVQ